MERRSGKFLTIEEYQHLTGASYHTVLKWIRTGQVHARKAGSMWQIYDIPDTFQYEFSVSCVRPRKMTAKLQTAFVNEENTWKCSGDIYCDETKILHFEGPDDIHEKGKSALDAEIYAVCFVLEEAKRQRISDLIIYHHHEGIPRIIEHFSKYPGYAAVQESYSRLTVNCKISFLHDSALLSDIKINPKCQEAIATFNQKMRRTRKDYIELKTYGADGYSVLSLKELKGMVDDPTQVIISRKIDPGLSQEVRDRISAAALRWYLRGLTPSCAAIKATIDNDMFKKEEKWTG